MKKIVTITDTNIINEILETIEYGTLALCENDRPYSLPINFIKLNNEIYFHGKKKGKKMDIIKNSTHASFSVVESLSLLPSYFSNDKGNACPATQMYKSVIIEGTINIVDDYDEKVNMLQALMEKLQKEGQYIPLNNEMYKKAINATAIFKLTPLETTCKCNLGQNFNQQRYERVSEHLRKRGSKKDIETLNLINEYRN